MLVLDIRRVLRVVEYLVNLQFWSVHANLYLLHLFDVYSYNKYLSISGVYF